ncbi:MAG: FtsH protease activity modulator HflK [Alphaproteobacteria bacterium]|nr:FtsH protease activity modulator HflK [Alphaproteobacteria bacterium]
MTSNDHEGPWGPSGGDPQQIKKDSAQPNHSKGTGPRKPSSGGGGSYNPPPDLNEFLEKMKGKFDPYKPRSHLHLFVGVVAVVAVFWILSGVYMVAANQVGVVMRFGAYNRTEQAGLHYRLPAPFEEVLLPVVTAQNEIQIGFRNSVRGANDLRALPEESMMLTQDENIINVQFTVFWRVADVNDYLFEIRNPESTVKMAAESAMREVIGQNKLQFALTEGRSQIAGEAAKRLQELVDEYKAGIMITQINLQTVAVPDEVKDAFQDVVNARLDMERYQNEATAHVNEVIPKARGDASRLIQQAMAYRDQKVAVAKGDAERFKSVLGAYSLARDVTSKRLYLETMESVLGDAQKVITDEQVGTMPFYPLDALKNKKDSAR